MGKYDDAIGEISVILSVDEVLNEDSANKVDKRIKEQTKEREIPLRINTDQALKDLEGLVKAIKNTSNNLANSISNGKSLKAIQNQINNYNELQHRIESIGDAIGKTSKEYKEAQKIINKTNKLINGTVISKKEPQKRQSKKQSITPSDDVIKETTNTIVEQLDATERLVEVQEKQAKAQEKLNREMYALSKNRAALNKNSSTRDQLVEDRERYIMIKDDVKLSSISQQEKKAESEYQKLLQERENILSNIAQIQRDNLGLTDKEIKQQQKLLVLDDAIERYNTWMNRASYEHFTIGTRYSEGTENYNLKNMVAEAKRTIENELDIGGYNGDLSDRRPVINGLQRFINTYEPLLNLSMDSEIFNAFDRLNSYEFDIWNLKDEQFINELYNERINLIKQIGEEKLKAYDPEEYKITQEINNDYLNRLKAFKESRDDTIYSKLDENYTYNNEIIESEKELEDLLEKRESLMQDINFKTEDQYKEEENINQLIKNRIALMKEIDSLVSKGLISKNDIEDIVFERGNLNERREMLSAVRQDLFNLDSNDLDEAQLLLDKYEKILVTTASGKKLQLGPDMSLGDYKAFMNSAPDAAKNIEFIRKELTLIEESTAVDNLTSSYEGLADAVERLAAANKKVMDAYNKGLSFDELANQSNQIISEIANMFPKNISEPTLSSSGITTMLQSLEFRGESAKKLLSTIESNLDKANKQMMSETSALISNLANKYPGKFESAFGDIITGADLNTSTADKMYDALINREKEYMSEIQQRINMLGEFTTGNNDSIYKYQHSKSFMDLYTKLNQQLLDGDIGLDEANKQLEELTSKLDKFAVAREKTLQRSAGKGIVSASRKNAEALIEEASAAQGAITSYEELYAVLERYVNVAQQLKPTTLSEMSEIERLMQYDVAEEDLQSIAKAIQARYKNVQNIKSSDKKGLSSYVHINNDGTKYEDRINSNTLKDAQNELDGAIYNSVYAYSDSIDEFLAEFTQKKVKNYVQELYNRFSELEKQDDAYRLEAESFNAPLEDIMNKISERIGATDYDSKQYQILDQLRYRANDVDRYTLSVEANHIGKLLDLQTPYKEIEANAKRIKSYDELCSAVERYNTLNKKAYVYAKGTYDTLNESEEMERRELLSRFSASGVDNLRDYSNFNQISNINKLAAAMNLGEIDETFAQLQKTQALIQDLRTRYDKQAFKDVFGDIEEVSIANASQIYDTLIAKDQEHARQLAAAATEAERTADAAQKELAATTGTTQEKKKQVDTSSKQQKQTTLEDNTEDESTIPTPIDIVEKNAEAALKILNSAQQMKSAIANYANISDTRQLEEEVRRTANEILGADLTMGATSIEDSKAKLELFNKELGITVKQVWQLQQEGDSTKFTLDSTFAKQDAEKAQKYLEAQQKALDNSNKWANNQLARLEKYQRNYKESSKKISGDTSLLNVDDPAMKAIADKTIDGLANYISTRLREVMNTNVSQSIRNEVERLLNILDGEISTQQLRKYSSSTMKPTEIEAIKKNFQNILSSIETKAKKDNIFKTMRADIEAVRDSLNDISDSPSVGKVVDDIKVLRSGAKAEKDKEEYANKLIQSQNKWFAAKAKVETLKLNGAGEAEIKSAQQVADEREKQYKTELNLLTISQRRADVLQREATLHNNLSASSAERERKAISDLNNEMQNASIAAETLQDKLNTLGNVKGVDGAKAAIKNMTDAINEFNQAATLADKRLATDKFTSASDTANAYIKQAQQAKKQATVDTKAEQARVDSFWKNEFQNNYKYTNGKTSKDQSTLDSMGDYYKKKEADAQTFNNNMKSIYQDLMSTMTQINEADRRINDLIVKDGGTGIYQKSIQRLQTQKSALVAEMRSITSEINSSLNVQPDENGIAKFFDIARERAALTSVEIEKFDALLMQADKIGFDFASKVTNKVQPTIEKLASLKQMVANGTINNSDITENISAMSGTLLSKFGNFKKYTDGASAIDVMNFADKISGNVNALDKLAQAEARYFANHQKYQKGMDMTSDYTKNNNVDESIEKKKSDLNQFAQELTNGKAIITGFKQTADGITQLDFSCFDAGTNSMRNFSAAIGTLSKDVQFVETTVDRLTKSREMAFKQNDKMSGLFDTLQMNNIDVNPDTAHSSVVRLREVMQQLQNIMQTSTEPKEINAITRQAKMATAEVEKLLNQSIKLKNTVGAEAIGEFKEDSTRMTDYDQLKAAVQSYGAGIDGATLKLGKYNEKQNELNYTLTTGDGRVKHYTASVSKLDKAIISQNTGVTRLKTGFQDLSGIVQTSAKRMLMFYAGYNIFSQVSRVMRQGVGYIKEIDAAMTELKKVTDETDASYSRFLSNAAKTGTQIGATTSEYVQAAANFARLGYSMNDAGDMGKSALVYKNVGDGISNVEEATNSIISTMKAFGIEAGDTMSIVDKFNEVGAAFADYKVA